MDILHKIKRYSQSTETNCGPTALAQLFSFFGDNFSPAEIESKTKMWGVIGTCDGNLGQAAIEFGYKAHLTPQNFYVFDPLWLNLNSMKLLEELRNFKSAANNKNLKISIDSYCGFLEAGGRIEFKILSRDLIREKIEKHPVLVGLCSSYLYGGARPNDQDSYRYGHFVIINGYDAKTDKFSVVDPYHTIPFSKSGRYGVKSDRLVEAMFLAEATHDCTILEIEK